MSFLTASELTIMRTELEKTLPDTCVIQTSSYVTDGEGGGTITYAGVSGGTVACRVDPVGAGQTNQDLEFLKADTVQVYYQLTVPHDAPLSEMAQVVTSSITYEVVQLVVDNSWPLDRRAIIVEIRA